MIFNEPFVVLVSHGQRFGGYVDTLLKSGNLFENCSLVSWYEKVIAVFVFKIYYSNYSNNSNNHRGAVKANEILQ